MSDDSAMMSYYCTHNSRGDIIGIYNGDGILKAQYKYDSWGNVLSVTDENGNAITSQTHIGNLNPFRYRGYYYDTESGLYYLMSRYYDPVTHRFINADGYFQAGNGILGANTFAYCDNNPVNNSDFTGEHSSSITCGDPTCAQCNPSHIEFQRTHLKWLNRAHQTNESNRIVDVSSNGDFIRQNVSGNRLNDVQSTFNNSAFTMMGTYASTASQAIPIAAVSTIAPTALNINSYYNNPYLTDEQANKLTLMEGINVTGTIFLTAAVSLSCTPVGWAAAIVAVSIMAASTVGSYIISNQEQQYISENKKKWSVN